MAFELLRIQAFFPFSMYREFYGFSEYPFSLSPDPKFLFLALSHYEALSSMMAGVKERKGITLITGQPGTGKTTLIYALLKDFSEAIKTAFIFNTKLGFQDLLKEILAELEVPVFEDNLTNLLVLLSQYLKERMVRDETVAIIIDEAHNLEIEALRNLFGLYSRESAGAKLIQIIIVGQPELEAKLESQELQTFKNQIAIRRQILPLNPKECEEYIDHRLKVVGSSSSKVFTPEAILRIIEFSGGIPRIINLLCDNALITGYTSRPKIDERIAEKAIQELGYLPPRLPVDLRRENPPRFTLGVKKAIQHLGHLQILRGFGLHRLSLLNLILVILLFTSFGLGALRFLDWGAKLKFLWESGEKGISLEKPAERIVSVKGGWNITTLAEQYYHAANPTLLDLILEFNPQIIDLNRIYINQQINIPIITEELLLIPTPDQGYKIHLGTFSDKRPIEACKNNPALRDKKLEAVPRQVSPQTTWLRVMAAEFRTKEEGLMAIRNLRQQGLLPAFAGSSKQISTQR